MEWNGSGRSACLTFLKESGGGREGGREDAFIGFKRESLGPSAEYARRREEMEGGRPLEEGGNVAGVGE